MVNLETRGTSPLFILPLTILKHFLFADSFILAFDSNIYCNPHMKPEMKTDKNIIVYVFS